MNYNNVTWESEARRITAAFEIKRKCAFIANGFGAHHLKSEEGNLANLINERPMLFCSVSYSEVEMYFSVSEGLDQKADAWSGIAVDWHGNLTHKHQECRLNLLLAKGLFRLDLLSIEIEHALKVCVSAHQKVEWLLDYKRARDIYEF